MATSLFKKRQRPAACDPVLCPSCHEHIRAPPAVTAPRRLPCKHCVCAACLDALDLCDEVGCPFCAKPFAGHVLDVALAEYAEEVHVANAGPDDGPGAGPDAGLAPTAWKVAVNAGELLAAAMVAIGEEKGAAAVRAAGSDYAAAINAAAENSANGFKPAELEEDLESMTCVIGTAQQTLRAAAEVVRGEDASLLRASVAARVAGFQEDVAALHAALDASSREVVCLLRAEEAARLKALNAAADEMTVSAGQLGTSAASTTAALATGNSARILEAAVGMAGVESLGQPRAVHGICLDAPAVPPLSGVVAAMAALVRTQVRLHVVPVCVYL
jgi:hypothetical protein